MINSICVSSAYPLQFVFPIQPSTKPGSLFPPFIGAGPRQGRGQVSPHKIAGELLTETGGKWVF